MVTYSFEHPAIQRQGMAENASARDRDRMLRDQMTPEMARRIVAMHQTWPDIEPGVLAALAFSGLDPTDDIARQIEEASVLRQGSLGFHDPGEVVNAQMLERENQAREDGNPVLRTLRTGVRGAFYAMESASDEVNRRFTAGSAALQDSDLSYSQAMELSTPSMAALAMTDEFDAGTDLGDGWIPGGAIRERKEELKQRLTIDGEWMSPGRSVAINVTEPGTRSFNIMSGSIDAAFRIFADPSTYALAGAGKLRHASKAFSTDSSLIRGIRRGTDEEFTARWWTQSLPGQRLRNSLLEEEDAYEIWRRLGGPQGRVDRETALALSEARTYQHLDDIMIPGRGEGAVARMGLGPQDIAEKPIGSVAGRAFGKITDPFFVDDVGAVHGVGYRIRRGAEKNARWTQWMPDGSIDTSDPNRAMVTLHRFLIGVKASDEDAARVMNRAIKMGSRDPSDEYMLLVQERARATRRLSDMDDSPHLPSGRDRASYDAERGQLNEMVDRLNDEIGEMATEEFAGWIDIAKDVTSIAAERALRDSVGYRATTTGSRAARREQHIMEDLGRAFERKHDEVVSYFQTEASSPHSNMVTWVDGREYDMSKIPHLTTEYLARNVPLPDMQDLRRHIGGYAKAMQALDDLPRGAFEGLTDGLSGMMTGFWKPMVLLRGAYITRVVGEEQLRMAASGMDSLFRHPIDYVLWLGGKRGAVAPSGDLVKNMKEFQGIAQRKGGGHIGRKPGDVALRDRVRYERYRSDGSIIDDQAFVRAWADDLSMLVNDTPAAIVAREGLEGATDYLMSAKGKKIRYEIAQSPEWRDVVHSPEAMRRYLGTVETRIAEKTRNHPELIEAIATGRIGKNVVTWEGPTGGGGPSNLQGQLMRLVDEVGITEVQGRRFVSAGDRASSSQNLLGRFDQTVDYLADIIMSKPTNNMSRFPTWQQAFVKNLEAQMGFMDASTQRRMIQWARNEANLSRTQARRMERTAKAGQGNTITDIETAELIAKAAATRDTRKLLYELTELGQFSDMSRAAIPFAEAWKEIGLSWGRILRDRPHIARRGQQAIEGARGSGFFHTDPNTGEEMFTYPGGHFVSRALLSGAADNRLVQGALGVPGVGALATAGLGVAGAFMEEQPAEFDLQGNVQGLNLFAGSVMPGLGPTITMPASLVVPDRPDFEWIRENVLFPFGEPDVEQGFIEANLPAWMDKLRTAWLKDPDTDRIYAGSVGDVMKALMASGEYSTDSPEEMDRLMSVAKQRAKGLWLIRGASQFVVPTGPQAAFRVQDLEGEWWPYQVLATEYRRLTSEQGEDAAIQEFLGTFGTDLVGLIQAKSREIQHRPVTREGDHWIQENPDLVRDYPNTIGFIAPDDPYGEFNHAAFQRQFDEGTREQLTPQQMLWHSNQRLGSYAYRHATERIDAGPGTVAEKREARARIRAELMGRFPGFNSHIGATQRPTFEDQLREVEQQVNDPRLADEPAVVGMAEYMAARREAEAAVALTARRSTTFTSSQETAWIREWLRNEAERIQAEHPDFIPVWDRVFSRELADDEVIEPGQMGGFNA